MAKLNIERLTAKAPELATLELDGQTDYQKVKNALLKAGIKPANRLVWDTINALQGQDLEEADDFYE